MLRVLGTLGSSQPTGELMIDGGTLSLEKGISSETIIALEALGHKIEYSLGGFGTITNTPTLKFCKIAIKQSKLKTMYILVHLKVEKMGMPVAINTLK